MSLSEATDQATREEWRELGFFYDRSEHPTVWRLVGPADGLRRFSAALAEFAADPENAVPGEHQHFGPYFYLKVQTAGAPGIDASSISGTPEDLKRLAALVAAALEETPPGEIADVGAEYAPASGAALLLAVREPEFDPAEADPALNPGSAA